MKLPVVFVAALLLSACTTVEYVEVVKPQITTAPDPAAHLMLKCDGMGFTRGGEGHRLCVLRGIDRLKFSPQAQRRREAGNYQILPHAFPSLAPSNSIFLLQ